MNNEGSLGQPPGLLSVAQVYLEGLAVPRHAWRRTANSRISMKAEHELWAVALWVEKTHGRDGPDHIAEQVTRLAKAGDLEGVAKWKQIAERYDALVVRPGLPS